MSGKWCRGHGVDGQAESLRDGHYVEAYLVPDNFSTNSHGDRGPVTGLAPRCHHCRSIRQWHNHGPLALARARTFMNPHAERWVKTGRGDTIERVLEQMDIGGLTVDLIADKIVAAIGEPCP